MEEDKRGPNQAAEQPADGAPDGSESFLGGQAQAGAEPAADLLAHLAAQLDALKAENLELKDRNLRLVAEMENFRRRTERDKAEFAKYAISDFARDIVVVGDNIRRAIEAVPKDAVASDPALRSLIEGVEVTERELLKALEKHNVKRFDPLGEPFNPHLHDAMTKIEMPNVPADTVVQTIHAGYMIDDRVLRPAAVIVAKGGQSIEPPKPSAVEAKEEPVPPGAMKVPDDVVSSASLREPPAPRPPRPDVQQNVLGRDFHPEKRRTSSPASGNNDRVAPFRRPRSAAGDQSFTELRTQHGSAGASKSSALHKPVIGSDKE